MTKKQAKQFTPVPRYFPGEQEAVATVKALGAQYGYGNLISHLKQAWSERMQSEWGFDKRAADYQGGLICAWCDTDTRTGKKVKRAKVKP